MNKPIILDNIETEYLINEDGQIFSKKTNKFLTGTIYNTGYQMVRLTTPLGKKGYAVHRLVAQAFIPNPNNLPVVNHIDGDKTNNKVSNLEWVDQSQNRQHAIQTNIAQLAVGEREIREDILEDGENWKRYLDTNYLVSKNGAVYNEKTKILLKQTPNSSGYIRYSLRIDGQSKSKQAHILVMETWRPDLNLDGLVINHLDGDKTNNSLENLEAVTKSENALHACYALKKNVKAVIQTLPSGEIIKYPSIMEAARQNNVTDSAIRYALKNNKKCCQSMWQYE